MEHQGIKPGLRHDSGCCGELDRCPTLSKLEAGTLWLTA